MKSWNPERLAEACGGRLLGSPRVSAGPQRVVIDSRQAGPGTLFVGLRGERVDGGEFASQALAAGAWGVLVADDHAQRLVASAHDARAGSGSGGVVLAAADPLLALQRLSTAWRRELGAKVIAVTGSTGKTTTKDILVSLLAPVRNVAYTRANFNTEIGVPLEILAAPAGTEVLVLEHAMRGAGQIAELAAISEPDVAVIVNVGPVHLELLGSVEAIAAAKAELIAALREGGTAVVPAREPLLEPFLRAGLHVIRFGPGGEVSFDGHGAGSRVGILLAGRRAELEVPFAQPHLRTNLLAAAAAALAVGVIPSGRVDVAFSPGRGQRTELPEGITVIDDCYNANPMSVHAALEDLASSAATAGSSRRVAVLGDMLELGPSAPEYHVEAGRQAAAAGVELLVTVGPLARTMADGFRGEVHPVATAAQAASLVRELVRPGDVVLVKGSRGVGLEVVCSALTARH